MRNSRLFIALFSLLFCPLAHAQWDYGQHAIDNMVESRIDIRKTRARMKARKGSASKSRKSTRNSKSTRNRARSVSYSKPKAVPSLPSNVDFHRDTYQDFHLSDSKGYIVNFVFTSSNGKVLRRDHNYTYYNSGSEFKDIPVGKYKVTAQAAYGGKKYPVHLGSEDGDTNNPMGGNFAPSIGIEVKPGTDQWGTKVLLTTPETLLVRVIE